MMGMTSQGMVAATHRRVSLESFRSAREPAVFLIDHVSEMLRDAGIKVSLTASVRKLDHQFLGEEPNAAYEVVQLRLEKL